MWAGGSLFDGHNATVTTRLSQRDVTTLPASTTLNKHLNHHRLVQGMPGGRPDIPRPSNKLPPATSQNVHFRTLGLDFALIKKRHVYIVLSQHSRADLPLALIEHSGKHQTILIKPEYRWVLVFGCAGGTG